MTEPKVIKRYANRKLYDTERSCYVTLDEIAQMVKDGEDVRVVDNKSKEDLTAVTMAQIIVEEEKKVARMPLSLLRGIIQSSNETLTEFYQKRVADPVTHFREDVERRATSLFKREEKDAPLDETSEAADAEIAADASSTEGDAVEDQSQDGGGPVRAFVASTTGAFEGWQKRIDERVKEGLSTMTNFTQLGTELEGLKARIAELEDRLEQAEGRRDQ